MFYLYIEKRVSGILYILFFSSIVLIFKNLWKKDIKFTIDEYKSLSNRQKDYFQMILLIFICPLILFALDSLNIFSSFLPFYNNITKEYDWLSFIGSYSSAIVSAFLLIIITEQDRRANNIILRNSQRPYLDICYMKIDDEFFKKNDDKIFILNHGTAIDLSDNLEYLTLCIKNNGASVAIINPNRTKVILEYKEGNVLKTHEATINVAVNRLTIKSGEEIYIKFLKRELYKNKKLLEDSRIVYSIIYYKDLFDVNYVDECKLEDNLKIIRDNEVED